MYTKDKVSRITVRVTEENLETLRQISETMGITPSEYLRQAIHASCYAWKQAVAKADELSAAAEGEAKAEAKAAPAKPRKTSKATANLSDKSNTEAPKKSTKKVKKVD